MQKRNVIVVMLDSLGANDLGCMGNEWIKTPNIDRLAKEGVLFENNYIEGLPTIPCRRSMLTGRYQLPFKGWGPLDLDDTTIADLCWGRPIDTAFIYDSPPNHMYKFGYSRGFDKVWFLHGHEADDLFYAQDPLIHLDPRDFIEDHVLEAISGKTGDHILGSHMDEMANFLRQRQYWKTDEDQNVAKVMKMAAKYLENIDRNKSFFLWVDSFDPHEPWDPPSVYDPDLKCPYDPDYKGKDMFLPPLGTVEELTLTEAEMHHIRMLVAEKVTVCDKWLGYLMDKVRTLGLEDDTLFLLVSDHGEPLGNGKHGHGLMRKCRAWPYEELVHAPMIMKGPGIPAGNRVTGFTQSCDVAPTVTDFLGIGVHPSHTGKSLLPLAKGEVDKVRDFAIAGWYGNSAAIYTHDWSYIHWMLVDETRTGMQKQMDAYAVYDWPASQAMGFKRAWGPPLDAAAQWGWTSAKTVDLPPTDQLFDRKEDYHQLNDVAKKNPKKATEMLRVLGDFMSGLLKNK